MGKGPTRAPRLSLSPAPPLLVRVSIISVFAHFVTFATSFAFIPVYAREIGGSESQIGYISTAMFAGGVAGTVCAPWVARKIGYPAAIVLGVLMVAAATVVVPSLGHVFSLGVSQAVGGFGRGLEAALLMTLAVLAVVTAQRATAMGMYQAVYTIGMITGPVVAGVVADSVCINAVFYVSTAIALAGGALVLTGRFPKTTE